MSPGHPRPRPRPRRFEGDTGEPTNEQLAVRASDGDEWAMEQLVAKNQGLVARYARKYLKSCHLLTLEDLMAEGSAGIVIAARKFDPSKKVKFSTYSAWWIRHEVSRAAQDTDTTVRIPIRVHADAHSAYLGRPLTPSRQSYVDAANRVRRLVELDAPLGPDSPEEHQTRLDRVASGWESPEEAVGEKLDLELARRVVAGLGLTERESAVLERRIMGEETLLEVAETFGCSRERIRQIEVVIRRRLRAASGTDSE